MRIHHALQRFALGKAALQQILSREGAYGGAHQRGQKRKLGRGQVENRRRFPRVTDGRDNGRDINLQPLPTQNVFPGVVFATTPEHGLNARHHFARVVGFDHIIVGAVAQRANTIGHVSHCGHHNHRHIAFPPQAGQHLGSV